MENMPQMQHIKFSLQAELLMTAFHWRKVLREVYNGHNVRSLMNLSSLMGRLKRKITFHFRTILQRFLVMANMFMTNHSTKLAQELMYD